MYTHTYIYKIYIYMYIFLKLVRKCVLVEQKNAKIINYLKVIDKDRAYTTLYT